MSFFGLTSLGPKNTFREASRGQPTLHLFLEIDLKKAFEDVTSKETYRNGHSLPALPAKSITRVLDVMYLGPAPEMDLQLLMEEIEGIESISWKVLNAAFKSVVDKIELKLKDDERSYSLNYYGSSREYRDSMQRHKRTRGGPEKVLGRPLTSSQDYGWKVDTTEQKQEIFGKKSCPETIYAAELIKSNVIF